MLGSPSNNIGEEEKELNCLDEYEDRRLGPEEGAN
jgi:hypothetical protein